MAEKVPSWLMETLGVACIVVSLELFNLAVCANCFVFNETTSGCCYFMTLFSARRVISDFMFGVTELYSPL